MADHLTLAAVILGGTFAALYVMWVVYLAVMNLSRAKRNGTLSKTAHALGTPLLQTPNLETLVERGMTFTRCYTMGSMSGAVCAPSRAMLLTGRSGN